MKEIAAMEQGTGKLKRNQDLQTSYPVRDRLWSKFQVQEMP